MVRICATCCVLFVTPSRRIAWASGSMDGNREECGKGWPSPSVGYIFLNFHTSTT